MRTEGEQTDLLLVLVKRPLKLGVLIGTIPLQPLQLCPQPVQGACVARARLRFHTERLDEPGLLLQTVSKGLAFASQLGHVA